MRGRDWIVWGALAAALTAAAPGAATAEPRGVLELFTSQGCSSCPQADKLLGDFAKDPSLIPLTLAIDYWDYLGWKDTLALAGHARRQRAYARVRNDRDVFTPQMVINGVAQAVGSDRAAIERALVNTKRSAQTPTLPVTLTVADGRVNVTAPDAQSEGASGEVWLCPLSKAVEVAIGRGENSGRTITYHNVVRRWVKVGVWNGKAETWSVPLEDIRSEGVDGVAVLLQSGTAAAPGPVLGAALASVPEKNANAAVSFTSKP